MNLHEYRPAPTGVTLNGGETFHAEYVAAGPFCVFAEQQPEQDGHPTEPRVLAFAGTLGRGVIRIPVPQGRWRFTYHPEAPLSVRHPSYYPEEGWGDTFAEIVVPHTVDPSMVALARTLGAMMRQLQDERDALIEKRPEQAPAPEAAENDKQDIEVPRE